MKNNQIGWQKKKDDSSIFVRSCRKEGYSDTVVPLENSDDEPDSGEISLHSSAAPPLQLSLPDAVRLRAATLARVLDSNAFRSSEQQAPFRFNDPPADYSSAGDDEMDTEDATSTAAEIPTPFYDDQIDEENRQWVDENLRRHKESIEPSDARLSCPCCFTEVCVDTTRDAKCPTKYHAKFAVHCTVQPEDGSVHCIDCHTTVGRFHNDTYTFDAVVPSHA